MTRKTVWLFLLSMLCQTVVYAQISMSNPREKFSLTASVDGVGNSSYTWDTDNDKDVADGRMTHQMNVKLRSSIKLVS
jgi:hypothetical protein